MPSYAEGHRFFINEFDESLDLMLLDLVQAVYANDRRQLSVYINSEGGDASRAFSVVSLIEVAKAKGKTVETVVLHDAHSSGSLVAVSGNVRKVAHRGSYLLHYGQTDMVANGPVEMARIVESNNRHFNTVRQHYLDNTKASIDMLDEFLLHDNYYLPADEAVRLGFADDYL